MGEVYDHLAAHWGPNHTHPFDVLGVRLWCPVLQQKRLFAMPLGSQANIANEGVGLQTSAKKITENDLPRLKEHVETIAREITANGQVSPPGCAVIFYNVLVQHAGVQTFEDEHTTSNTHEDKLVKIAREALGVSDSESESEDEVSEPALKKARVACPGPLEDRTKTSMAIRISERQWWDLVAAIEAEMAEMP